jgi:hypothetical protein
VKLGKYTIDQIENNQALLLWREDEEVRYVRPVTLFPFEVKEGDIINVTENGSNLEISLLSNETEEAKKKAEMLLNKIINKNKK